MNTPYNKLSGRIIEKYGSHSNFAKAVGISKNSMSKKMTGKSGISQSDMILWGELLDIKQSDFGDFFIPKELNRS